jgi:hypothetical protein
MTALADRGDWGTFNSAEQEELKSYLRVGNLINLLQAKGSRSLAAASCRRMANCPVNRCGLRVLQGPVGHSVTCVSDVGRRLHRLG